MSDSNSDEDFYITQNAFREAESDQDIAFLDEFLFGAKRLHSHDERSQGSIADAKISKRVVATVSDAELEKRNAERIPAATKHNTNWAVRAWQEWAQIRNREDSRDREDLYGIVESDILKLQNNNELSYWMSKFVVEIRKKKPCGERYPPNTLYQLCCGIQRHFRENGRPELNIFDNPCFKKFQDSLDGEMKRLTAQGYGVDVREAQAFTEEQEGKLWDVKLLGDHSAQVLLDTMVFMVGKNFALRSGKEHRDLRFEQFRLTEANELEPEKLVYNSFGEKNNQGGLKHRSIKRKRIEHYANSEIPQRCLVSLYKTYVAKCPTGVSGCFYLVPKRKINSDDKEWFTRNPVGHNTLGNTVRRLCQAAGIQGHFTNHSLRATAATRGLVKGLPQKYIMERTGHRDVRSLQKYERPDIQTKIGFCKSLDCGAVTRDKEKGDCLNEEPAQDVPSIRDFNVSTKQDVKPEDMERKKRRLEIPERSYFDKCVFNFF